MEFNLGNLAALDQLDSRASSRNVAFTPTVRPRQRPTPIPTPAVAAGQAGAPAVDGAAAAAADVQRRIAVPLTAGARPREPAPAFAPPPTVVTVDAASRLPAWPHVAVGAPRQSYARVEADPPRSSGDATWPQGPPLAVPPTWPAATGRGAATGGAAMMTPRPATTHGGLPPGSARALRVALGPRPHLHVPVTASVPGVSTAPTLSAEELAEEQEAAGTAPQHHVGESSGDDDDEGVIDLRRVARRVGVDARRARWGGGHGGVPTPSVPGDNAIVSVASTVPEASLTLRDVIKRGEQAAKMRVKTDAAAAKTAAAAAAPATLALGASSPAVPSAGTIVRAAGVTPAGVGAGAGGPTSRLTPQVTVVDGRIVVDDASLVVPANDGGDGAPYARVVETATRLNASSYAPRSGCERWSENDTAMFYAAISQFGTDFTLIERLFPGRTRRHIKNKYKSEEAKPGGRLDAALAKYTAGDEAHAYTLMLQLLQNEKTAAAGAAAAGNGEVAEAAGDDAPTAHPTPLLGAATQGVAAASAGGITAATTAAGGAATTAAAAAGAAVHSARLQLLGPAAEASEAAAAAKQTRGERGGGRLGKPQSAQSVVARAAAIRTAAEPHVRSALARVRAQSPQLVGAALEAAVLSAIQQGLGGGEGDEDAGGGEGGEGKDAPPLKTKPVKAKAAKRPRTLIDDDSDKAGKGGDGVKAAENASVAKGDINNQDGGGYDDSITAALNRTLGHKALPRATRSTRSRPGGQS